MSSANLGFTTVLKRGDGGGPEVFTTIAEIVTISGPSLKVDAKDVTNMDSANSTKEFIPGLVDAGDIKLECNWVPGNASHGNVLSDIQNRRVGNWQIVLPSTINKTWSFSAFVTSFEPTYPIDDKIGMAISFKVSGKPTLA